MTDGYEVRYICPGCGEHRFMVRYRNNDEDIISYMDNVIKPGIGKSHRQKSPSCTNQTVDLKLHLPAGSEGVGMRVKQ